jgi:large subunit ribosomal protein L20
MPRVPGGTKTVQRRKKILKKAKGYYGARSKLKRHAKETVARAQQYAYRDRRRRKRDFRKLWILRINAASRAHDLSYSRLVHGLKLANVDLDRKVLADMAVADPEAFSAVCDTARTALTKA